MRNIAILVCCLLFVGAMLFAWDKNDTPPPICRVLFGSSNANEILVGRRPDALLIYRDGTTDSTAESYPMVDGKLAPECEIPPFKYGDATFTLTGCYENITADPMPRNGLMLYGTINENDLVLSSRHGMSANNARSRTLKWRRAVGLRGLLPPTCSASRNRTTSRWLKLTISGFSA